MRLLLPLSVLLTFLLQSCFTTHDVFIPNPVPTEKVNHELSLNTNFALLGLPNNIGLAYQGNTKEIGGNPFRLNYFIRTQNYFRNVLIESGGFDGESADFDNSNSAKIILMPSFHLNEKSTLGLGLGLNYIYHYPHKLFHAGNYNAFAPTLSLNFTKVIRKKENGFLYMNFGINLSKRFNPMDGVHYERDERIRPAQQIGAYYYEADTTIIHEYTDYCATAVTSSFKFSLVNERRIKDSKYSLIFKFDVGVAYYGDLKRNDLRDRFPPVYREHYSESSQYYSYDTFLNFPLGFSLGFKF